MQGRQQRTFHLSGEEIKVRVPHGTSMVFVRTGGPRLPTAYLAFRPPPRVISTASPLVAPSPRPACDPPPLPDFFPALSSPSHSSFLHTRSVRFLSSLGPRPPCPQNHHLGHQAPADPPEQHPAPPHVTEPTQSFGHLSVPCPLDMCTGISASAT